MAFVQERGDYVPTIRFAREHLRVGDQEETLKWLTLACEERNVYSLMIASDPFYDPLRADQRFVMFRDYRCVLLADCVGEPIGSELPRSNHEASILTIQTVLGWVSDSERFQSALQARRPVAAAADLSQL